MHGVRGPVGYGRVEAGGWYLVRHPEGRYGLGQMGALSGRPLVATRSIRALPFPQEKRRPLFCRLRREQSMRSTIAAIGAAR